MTVAVRAKIGLGDVVISDTARANVLDVLATGRLSYGTYSKRFERDFAEMHHRRFAAFVNSGTDALRIGLAAMKEHYGWPDGSEVLVPAVTFVASYNVILQNNLRPVLIDVDPNYYDINWDHVLRFLGRRDAAEERLPVAVMPVSLFGQPVLLPEIVRAFGVKVIEDSCETMFVGRSYADVTCYSTYVCHLINTGVGGLATTDDPDLARLIRSLANHGRSGIYTGIDAPLGDRETMDARFTFERVGYSSRATELEAALGCAEIGDLPRQVSVRRANARSLSQHLADLPLQLPKERIVGQHAYMMFPVLCQEPGVRDRLVEHLEAHGVETRPMLPLTNQPYLRTLLGEDVENRYPVAKHINANGFYVPSHHHLTACDLDTIVEAFRSFFS